jgi:hypothetical protein
MSARDEAQGAQKPRQYMMYGEVSLIAQRSDLPAQPFIQRFL